MGFFEKIFPKKSEPQKVVLEPQEILIYIGKKSGNLDKELEKNVFSKLSEIKYLLGKINSGLFELKKREVSLSQGNLRLRKVVVTSQASLFTQLNHLMKRLEPPKTADLHKIMDYTLDSCTLLSYGIFGARKSIVYTKTILGPEIKELGESINELDAAFKNLKGIFETSSISQTQNLTKNADVLNQELLQQKELQNSLREKKIELQTHFRSKEKILLEIKELGQSPEMKELSQLEEKKAGLISEKRRLREKFVSILGEIEKPLSRFLQLANTEKFVIPAHERELLELYLKNSLLAIKKDENAKTLKKILGQAGKLVADSTIILKEKEKDKKQAALKELEEFDFFNEIFQKINSIDSEIILLDSRIKNFSLNERIASLDQQLNSAEREILEKNNLVKNFSAKIAQKEKEIFSIKELLQADLSKNFGEEIVIKTPPQNLEDLQD